MTKTQTEYIVTGILGVLLIYLLWSTFFKEEAQQQAGTEPRQVVEEVAQVEPDIPPPPAAPVHLTEELLQQQSERMELDWGPDPFLLRSEIEPVPQEREEAGGLVLKGIAKLREGKKALVGTDIVAEGDTIHGYEVVLISESHVVLSKKGEEYEIRIHK